MSFPTALLVLSDSRAAGERKDAVIPACRAALAGSPFELVDARIIPDDHDGIVAVLRELAAGGKVALILTAGGTGLATRDNAPEATREVITRPADGLADLLRLRGLDHTPKAALSRGVAGVAGRTLIINFPGSPRAMRESLETLLPILPHALETLLGRASECARPEEQTLDMRGKPCPQPVVAVRKALLAGAPALRIIVDNAAARENVTRLADGMGWHVQSKERAPDEMHLLITRGAGPGGRPDDAPVAKSHRQPAGTSSVRTVVLVAGARFGDGDPELGAILMRAFIKTLKELAPRPAAVIFVNGGVKLTTAGSPLLDDIEELARGGSQILSCGTCLDFFHFKEKLGVGAVSNMFEIVTHLAEADRVIRP